MTAIQISFSEESKERLVLSVADEVELRMARMISQIKSDQPPEDPRKWRTRKEVAEMFGVSTKTVQRWEGAHGLKQDPSVGGKSAAYPMSEIDRLKDILSRLRP